MSANSSHNKSAARAKRKVTIRKKVNGTPDRPRLTIYRSLANIYAQVIDDAAGKTLAAASTLSAELKDAKGKKTDLAKQVGQLIAKKCLEAKVDKVVFDRNGFNYHGRIAAVAEGAREGGLKF
jgi:large subunit ribosomal protein L18